MRIAEQPVERLFLCVASQSQLLCRVDSRFDKSTGFDKSTACSETRHMHIDMQKLEKKNIKELVSVSKAAALDSPKQLLWTQRQDSQKHQII